MLFDNDGFNRDLNLFKSRYYAQKFIDECCPSYPLVICKVGDFFRVYKLVPFFPG